MNPEALAWFCSPILGRLGLWCVKRLWRPLLTTVLPAAYISLREKETQDCKPKMPRKDRRKEHRKTVRNEETRAGKLGTLCSQSHQI